MAPEVAFGGDDVAGRAISAPDQRARIKAAIVQNLKRLLFPLYCWLLGCWSRPARTIASPSSTASTAKVPTPNT